MTYLNPLAAIKEKNHHALKTVAVAIQQVIEQPSNTTISLAHYQVAMEVDVARLSTLKVMEEKQAAKRKMLATYADFVTDYMNSGHNYPNSVAVQVMIWLFDVEAIEPALKLAFYLMPHQSMPDKFNRRDIQTFVCDAMYDWAKAQLDSGKTAIPLIDEVVAKLDSWELSPPVASKVLVIAAKHHNAAEHFNTVVEYLEKAQRLNPEGWGAKTLLATAKVKL